MVNLDEQVQSGRLKVSADNISMSISELTSLYREGTLIIRPEFQRLFRWNEDQKSKLIESIMLGIPLPSIFVAADEDGRWELVDGLQRVSTLLELQGLLVGEDGKIKPELVLTETGYLSALEGKSWGGSDQLSDAQKRDLRLSRLDVRVVKRSSGSTAKFDLFQRLNSFGSALTSQEIRTALIAGENPDALRWLNGLARHDSFVAVCDLGERQIKEQYDLELVLRFLMLHNREIVGKRGGLGDFPGKLDKWTIEFIEDFEVNAARAGNSFKRSFDYISDNADGRVFRKWNPSAGVFQGAFSNTAFEVIAIGTGYLVSHDENLRDDVLEASKELWLGLGSTLGTVTGMATGDRIAKTVLMGRELMAA